MLSVGTEVLLTMEGLHSANCNEAIRGDVYDCLFLSI